MAKVIERGEASKQVARHRCINCDSLVDYYQLDVMPDQRDGDYVVCPICKAWISTKVLRWALKTAPQHRTTTEWGS